MWARCKAKAEERTWRSNSCIKSGAAWKIRKISSFCSQIVCRAERSSGSKMSKITERSRFFLLFLLRLRTLAFFWLCDVITVVGSGSHWRATIATLIRYIFNTLLHQYKRRSIFVCTCGSVLHSEWVSRSQRSGCCPVWPHFHCAIAALRVAHSSY